MLIALEMTGSRASGEPYQERPRSLKQAQCTGGHAGHVADHDDGKMANAIDVDFSGRELTDCPTHDETPAPCAV